MGIFSKKRKSVNYKNYLTEKEKVDYEQGQYNIRRVEALKKLREIKIRNKAVTNPSLSQSIGGFLTNIGKLRPAASAYSRSSASVRSTVAPRFYNKVSLRTGRRGRPAGSYSPQYAAYGGVYEFRKRMAFERKMALRNAAVTPQQQEILRQIELRKQAQRMSPERRTIPDTAGTVPLKDIHNEIDSYANEVP